MDHIWDRVDLKIEDRQEDLGIHSLVCLDPIVKIRIVDMLKFTTHTSFMFEYWFFVFGLTNICFHE